MSELAALDEDVHPNKRIKLDHSSDDEYDDDSDVSEILGIIDDLEEHTREVLEEGGHEEEESTLPTGDELRKELRRIGVPSFLEKYIVEQENSTRDLFDRFGLILSAEFDELDDEQLVSLLIPYCQRECKRQKLPEYTCFDDVVRVIQQSSKIIVITGAGISTSLGIPDFRSADGIYSRLEKYNLSDPQEMFDIALFKDDPSIFYDFAKELLPEDRGYSPTHAFIKVLQDKGKLLTQYTQNIDNIESVAGITEDKLIQCHGSFRLATCMSCHREVPGETIFPAIKAGEIPMCEHCDGIMKPNITFFGEQLQTSFKERIMEDRTICDLLICIGTSLRVAPVAEIPNLLAHSIPQIYINRDAAHKHVTFDVELLGDNDDITTRLATSCGYGPLPTILH